jgi:hypothetical protein
MICHDKRCIFIHIPKTAGTSIEYSFKKVKVKGDKVKSHPKTKHHTLEQYKDQFPEEFNNYYKFTVVRNPWEREYSLWRFMNDTYNKKMSLNKIFNIFTRKDKGVRHSFVEYLRNLDQDIDFYIKDSTFAWKHLFRDQLEYIIVNESLELDQIIRYERLSLGFDEMCKRLDRYNQELPRIFYSGEKSHLERYSQEEIDLVSKIRKKDIDFLGYSI